MPWTATSIAPRSSLASRTPSATLPALPESSVGPINSYSQLPITADMLRAASPDFINDSSLASRSPTSPGAGTVAASTSVYRQPNAPAFLQQSIANLNAEQALRRSSQAELLDRITKGVAAGGPDAYLWMEALRAASVSPGAHVNFAEAIQNPVAAQAQFDAAQAFKQKTQQNTSAINTAQNAASNVAKLQQRRTALGSAPFGMYQNSPQQRLDQQLMDAQMAAQPESSVQKLGRAAAGNNLAFPTY